MLTISSAMLASVMVDAAALMFKLWTWMIPTALTKRFSCAPNAPLNREMEAIPSCSNPNVAIALPEVETEEKLMVAPAPLDKPRAVVPAPLTPPMEMVMKDWN